MCSHSDNFVRKISFGVRVEKPLTSTSDKYIMGACGATLRGSYPEQISNLISRQLAKDHKGDKGEFSQGTHF